ncbi:acid phosphatase family membrane protein YuiD [Bacilli bacterium PM5-3]|nr:acid phosphatase family membrane protein YuiD [Bacilli bacterium PM5-3]MDH6603464.1 acid phosphatase family membrane protein YuiD [Bacilli bacterium PM5-9]
MMAFYPLVAAVLSAIIAQLLKPFTKYKKTKKIDIFEILAAGGFPSSHTSTLSALALSFGLRDGFDSSAFAISFIMMVIIAYDAMNVRLYAGKHIAITHQLIDDLKELKSIRLDDPIYFTKMKKILGHERFEVAGGFLLGLIISLILFYGLGGF